MPFALPAVLPGPVGKFRKSSGKRSFGKPDEGEVAVDADRGVAILYSAACGMGIREGVMAELQPSRPCRVAARTRTYRMIFCPTNSGRHERCYRCPMQCTCRDVRTVRMSRPSSECAVGVEDDSRPAPTWSALRLLGDFGVSDRTHVLGRARDLIRVLASGRPKGVLSENLQLDPRVAPRTFYPDVNLGSFNDTVRL